MNKLADLFLVCFVSLNFAGCATSDVLELSAATGQQAITRDGTPSLVSYKGHVVMLRPVSKTIDSSGRPTFVVAMKNLSDRNVEFRENQITAQLMATGAALKVYRYAELVEEEKTQQRNAAIVAGLAGVAGAMNAANSGYTTTTGNYSAYNSYGGSSYGSFNATTYDPNRAMVAQQLNSVQTSANFANIKAQGEQNLVELESSILKSQTVFPQEWHGGVIVLNKPIKDDSGNTSYVINVQFAGELHRFTVAQSKVSQ